MKYSINDGVISYSIGNDEFVVYNSNDDILVILNNEGQMLWDVIENEEQLGKLIEESGYIDDCHNILKTLEEKNCIRSIK